MTVSEISHQAIFGNAIAALQDPQPQRVWSVIVSLFGDLAQGEGDQISGVALTEICGRMGIRAEALRVALHRLRKDGWIDSLRDGRSSQHTLTAQGRRDTISATPRIYAQPPHKPGTWRLISADCDTALKGITYPPGGFIALSRRTALISGDGSDLADNVMVFRATPEHIPQWMQDKVCPTDLQASTRQFHQDLLEAHKLIENATGSDPVHTSALRTQIVHRWRRVVLRTPDLPNEFFPSGWMGDACRKQVTDLLALLPRPDLNALEISALQYRNLDQTD
ncbi:PaaX family transcriptional regulator C-terminal domain-containing protein [Halocynthiibacter sp.]|uniref:PaaX family transcriptional regulator C-terminal domain-containing protein n=1 Tax=Halocynthiibacter sp. TaxID=1979210 RepID=UPI003C3859F5